MDNFHDLCYNNTGASIAIDITDKKGDVHMHAADSGNLESLFKTQGINATVGWPTTQEACLEITVDLESLDNDQTKWMNASLSTLQAIGYTHRILAPEGQRPMHISSEAMRQYDELVKVTPVPGISNEDLAKMVTAEEVAEALQGLRDRAEKFADGRLVAFSSPLHGVFYPSAAPDAPPLVNEGDEVEKGQELCLIEAMKVFSPVPYEGEKPAVVVEILAKPGQLVKQGEVLFVLEPCDQ